MIRWTEKVLLKCSNQHWFWLGTLNTRVAWRNATRDKKKYHGTRVLGPFRVRTNDFCKSSLVALPLRVDESQKPLVIGENSHVRVDEEDCAAAAARQNVVENSLGWANDDWWQRRSFILTAEGWMSYSSKGMTAKSMSLEKESRPLSNKIIRLPSIGY